MGRGRTFLIDGPSADGLLCTSYLRFMFPRDSGSIMAFDPIVGENVVR